MRRSGQELDEMPIAYLANLGLTIQCVNVYIRCTAVIEELEMEILLSYCNMVERKRETEREGGERKPKLAETVFQPALWYPP